MKRRFKPSYKGTWVRMSRKNLRMTQEELGDELGMCSQNISDIECDRRPIQRQTELAIKFMCCTTHVSPPSIA